MQISMHWSQTYCQINRKRHTTTRAPSAVPICFANSLAAAPADTQSMTDRLTVSWASLLRTTSGKSSSLASGGACRLARLRGSSELFGSGGATPVLAPSPPAPWTMRYHADLFIAYFIVGTLILSVLNCMYRHESCENEMRLLRISDLFL